MSDERALLRRTAELAADFLESLDERPVFPTTPVEELAAALGGALPDEPSDPLEVVELLAREADRGVVATAGPRYFGYVIGGALPATVGADWLTTAWDQCAGLGVLGPSAAVVEEIVGDWLIDLFGLPTDASFAITTGCQMAHVTALAAARHHVLAAGGWDLRHRGLAESAPITVVVGRLRHVTVDRALRLLGIGSAQLVVVDADEHGRMRPQGLRKSLTGIDGPTIVCAQAGEVNTGSYDPFTEIVEIVRESDAWLHIDGAFGLWAAVSPSRRHLLDGVAAADSWAADGHKWLNVPYDCGLVFCAKPGAHNTSMTMKAPYFEGQGKWLRDAADWTPESSRRARAFTVYAALRSLGRVGLADLVDRCCDLAQRFATSIAALPGCEAWMGGTTWEGRAAIRVSVSGWRTTAADIDRTVAAFEAALVAV
jgi:glutamate/tyrosine decarboxylase-like PLP-dependent enzyme